MGNFLSDESGQAVVEYVLAVAMAVSFVLIISGIFRRSLMRLWVTLTREVAAGCPSCAKDPSIR